MLPFLWHGLQSSRLACIPVTGTSQMACGKEFACQCRRCRFDPWVGKIPLRKGVAIHSSILAWRIPWTEEPSGLQSMGCRVGRDWVTEHAGCLSQHLVGTKVRRAYMFPLRCAVWSPGVKLYHVEKGIQQGWGRGWLTSANLGMDCLTWHPVDFPKASRVSLLPETDWWDGWRDGFPVWAPPAGQ